MGKKIEDWTLTNKIYKINLGQDLNLSILISFLSVIKYPLAPGTLCEILIYVWVFMCLLTILQDDAIEMTLSLLCPFCKFMEFSSQLLRHVPRLSNTVYADLWSMLIIAIVHHWHGSLFLVFNSWHFFCLKKSSLITVQLTENMYNKYVIRQRNLENKQMLWNST